MNTHKSADYKLSAVKYYLNIESISLEKLVIYLDVQDNLYIDGFKDI